MSRKITLTFDENDAEQICVYEYLKKKQRGKTKFITDLVHEHIRRTELVEDIKMQVLQELMEESSIGIISTVKESPKVKEKDIDREESLQNKEGSLDVEYLLEGASLFA